MKPLKNQVEINMLKVNEMEFFCKFYLKSEFENSSRTLAQFFRFFTSFP
jgi:hypothetical protein